MRFSIARADHSPYTFAASVEFDWSNATSNALSAGGRSVEVELKGVHRFYVDLMSRLHVWAYSASSIRFLIPAVLALGAVVTLLVKVIATYARAI